MKNCFTLFLISNFIVQIAISQSASWNFDGETNAPNSTASGFSATNAVFGSGVTSISYTTGNPSSGDAYTASSGWTTSTSPDLNDYIQVCITNNSGVTHTVSGIDFDERRSGTGVRSYQVRSSSDNYGSTIAVGAIPDDTNFREQTVSSNINLLNNGQLCFRIYGYNSENASSGTWRFDNVLIFSAPATPLPIELTKLNGNLFDLNLIVTWQTASELNNSHFSIEKSQDGFSFREIGIVNGNGTTNETQNYEFIDKTPFPGTNYYRLKQFDFDGKFEYSKVVSVDFGREGGVRLYPTIASTELYLQLDKKAANENGIIHVFNQNGMLVKSQNFEAESLNLTIPVYGLPNGHYFIRLETADFASILRFIKQ
jgi:hypothetical protein